MASLNASPVRIMPHGGPYSGTLIRTQQSEMLVTLTSPQAQAIRFSILEEKEPYQHGMLSKPKQPLLATQSIITSKSLLTQATMFPNTALCAEIIIDAPFPLTTPALLSIRTAITPPQSPFWHRRRNSLTITFPYYILSKHPNPMSCSCMTIFILTITIPIISLLRLSKIPRAIRPSISGASSTVSSLSKFPLATPICCATADSRQMLLARRLLKRHATWATNSSVGRSPVQGTLTMLWYLPTTPSPSAAAT